MMANNKPRRPMQVSDEFQIKMKELQRKIRQSTGEDKSLRDLTEEIAKLPFFAELEKKILTGSAVELRIRMDARRLI